MDLSSFNKDMILAKMLLILPFKKFLFNFQISFDSIEKSKNFTTMCTELSKASQGSDMPCWQTLHNKVVGVDLGFCVSSLVTVVLRWGCEKKNVYGILIVQPRTWLVRFLGLVKISMNQISRTCCGPNCETSLSQGNFIVKITFALLFIWSK